MSRHSVFVFSEFNFSNLLPIHYYLLYLSVSIERTIVYVTNTCQVYSPSSSSSSQSPSKHRPRNKSGNIVPTKAITVMSITIQKFSVTNNTANAIPKIIEDTVNIANNIDDHLITSPFHRLYCAVLFTVWNARPKTTRF